MSFNGLPLSQLSRMIEVNARETVGEVGLPEIPEPDARDPPVSARACSPS